MQRIAMYNLVLTRFAVLLAITCAISVFLYGIFLLMAVSHTASRTAAQRQIQKITDTVEVTEMRYLSQQKELTPEHAAALGFVKPQEVTTVFAVAEEKTLTLNAVR